MIFKIRLLAVLSLFLVCIGCDDDLDEVYQDTNKVVRSQLIKSIVIQYPENHKQTYAFKYGSEGEDNENLIESIEYKDKIKTSVDSGDDLVAPTETSTKESAEKDGAKPPFSINFKYNSDGELTNFDKVVDQIPYFDSIFKNPYEGKILDFSVNDRDDNDNPTLISMFYKDNDDGSIEMIEVEITYDFLALNPFYNLLLSGNIPEAANDEVEAGSRAKFFTANFIPLNNPRKVVFKNGNIEEYEYNVDWDYNDEKLPISGIVEFEDFTQEGVKPEVYDIIFSYVSDEE